MVLDNVVLAVTCDSANRFLKQAKSQVVMIAGGAARVMRTTVPPLSANHA